MAYVSREQIAVALFGLVSTAAGTVAELRTSSRRLRAIADVDPKQMPALFLNQGDEDYAREPGSMLNISPKRTMNFDIVLYTADPQADSIVPATQLNAMIDAIETALRPDGNGMSTLGGLAVSARIEGRLGLFPNHTDGKSAAVIPITVLRP